MVLLFWVNYFCLLHIRCNEINFDNQEQTACWSINVMVMTCVAGMGDTVLRERLPALWRRIEDAHYSYLETDESPEKLQQKKKLEDYIIEYLSLVPHECKFGLSETGKVFQRTINELPDFSAYRAGIGWAALARYATNLLAQPWRKEYRSIRLYSGYYKHEVEANLVSAETLLHAMGYKPAGSGRLVLEEPICPDMVAAVSRDALIAHCECQIMCQIWEAVWSNGVRATWAEIARQRAQPDTQHARSRGYGHDSDIYSNVPVTAASEPPHRSRMVDPRYHDHSLQQCGYLCEDPHEDFPVVPYMVPPAMMYPYQHPHEVPVTLPQCSTVPMMTPYGVPYYYPVQAPYMIPTPVYPPIKHATNVPINGYPPVAQYKYPAVPTGQLIEIESNYENGKFERYRDEDRHKRRQESSRRNSTSKSGFSDVTLPSLPRSDTQPTLSKAKEDGMGTYESWDYVFRNLSSKDHDESRSRFSPSLDRDSRTLDRLDREERRAKYQPTTLDLEDGLQALHLDRTYDEEMYRTAKVNENLMRMKQEQESKRTKQLAKKQTDERRTRKATEPIGNPEADALVPNKVAPDKVKLLTKKEIKERKDVIKQQNSANGPVQSTAEVKKVRKPAKLVAQEIEKPKGKTAENGHQNTAHSSKTNASSSPQSYDLKAQLIVSLDEPDQVRRSPPGQNGENRPASRTSSSHEKEKPANQTKTGKWECATCTYLNRDALVACDMCGKSRRGPQIEPLTSGGRECPACTLVNQRDARVCDACGTSLEHCPTYI